MNARMILSVPTCYLWNCFCRHVGLVEEYSSKVFLVGKDPRLLWQKSPATVYQVNARQIILQCNFLCPQVLLDGDGVVSPPFYRGIVCNHHAELTGHHSDSRDNSTTRNPVHISGQSGKFQYRGSGIAQCLHPIPGQEFLSFQVPFDCFRSTSLLGPSKDLIELVYLLLSSLHSLQIAFGVDVQIAIY